MKIEDHNDFIRIYLPSGDIDEVTSKSWESALVASGSNAYQYKVEDRPKATDNKVYPVGAGYDVLDSNDVEDVTNLSDGSMVPEVALSAPVDNAVVEGAEAVYDEATDLDPKDVLSVIRGLGLEDVTPLQIANIAAVMKATKAL